jgi:uracil-DNA glycosylase
MTFRSLKQLKECVVDCRLCPRLVEHRESVPVRRSYAEQEYWRRPVPGFGDPKAWLLIVGLAPSAHGGNRTGRLFTGDESARFLFQALHHVGLANQPSSESMDDGLVLHGSYMTAAVKCAPPDNRPLAIEIANCRQYLEAEFALLKHLKGVLALGQLAFDAVLHHAKHVMGVSLKHARFTHGVSCQLNETLQLYGSFHPSPQNTYTKKLTQEMLVSLLKRIQHDCLIRQRRSSS